MQAQLGLMPSQTSKVTMTGGTQIKILIIGATGQVDGKATHFFRLHGGTEIVAAVRSKEHAAAFSVKEIASVFLDFNDEATHRPALEGTDRRFVGAGYTVDMLLRAKFF